MFCICLFLFNFFGRFGYFDFDYFECVWEELEVKGIMVVEEEKFGKDKK